MNKNGNSRTIRLGFCWAGFFIPQLWAVSEGLWRPFAFTLLSGLALRFFDEAAKHYANDGLLVMGFIQYLLMMFCFGLYGQNWLVADLSKRGYTVSSLLYTDASPR